MRAHYLQHVPFEGLGSIKDWFEKTGYNITCTQLFKNTEFPDQKDIDFLVIMGGPMSINDESEYPWLVQEKRFIKEFVESGKPVLGICLGAQLLAGALGEKIYPNSVKEIGWFSVNAVTPANNAAFEFPGSTIVFHWHGETFDLPKGAVRIAETNVCRNQAFQIGKNVIGLQFHLEMTKESVQEIVANCRDELVPGEYIQIEENILSAPSERYNSTNQLMNKVLEYLHQNYLKS